MKLPRDVSGQELERLLGKYGCEVNRQTGSHIRLTTQQKGEHHITIPAHKELRVGTLSAILIDAAYHLAISREELIQDSFGYLSFLQVSPNPYIPLRQFADTTC
jgi:predicted RNA binding protein YcfA (HicA-like mRNA interferase family)